MAARPHKAMAPTQSEQRMAGRKLQARRLRIWTNDPTCAGCGQVTAFPAGFELDHRVPLSQGGADTDENCQVLCAGPDGCHAKKTATDFGQTRRRRA
ncbi:HNH endonuclease [Cupriavidus malaysiensis]|uniref:HNH endonuclease n=2 Tax=Cupriavidus malaysiensis TaxID=367825 RepID=A0ABN4TLD6_9BURK|nr:HNH endonuclease [Cupriavidus malaysiensis]